MAINEKASRDATSKAPVLVYSVNQDGWPASSPIAPQAPPPPLTAERVPAVAAAVAAAAPAAWARFYGPLSFFLPPPSLEGMDRI